MGNRCSEDPGGQEPCIGCVIYGYCSDWDSTLRMHFVSAENFQQVVFKYLLDFFAPEGFPTIRRDEERLECKKPNQNAPEGTETQGKAVCRE